jgi:phytoene dehydrogenase-like protein
LKTDDRFDFVIAGAGHDSLTCAAYLAKAGFRVFVLEGQQVIGEGCKTQEVLLRGFKEDLCSTCHTVILKNSLAIHNELDLDQYGYELLRPEVVLHLPFLDGASLTIFDRDIERTASTIAQMSKKDAETFRRLAVARGGAAVFETARKHPMLRPIHGRRPISRVLARRRVTRLPRSVGKPVLASGQSVQRQVTARA